MYDIIIGAIPELMLCFGYHTHPARPIPSPECFDAASRQWALIRLTALPETPAAAVSGE
jgi:hypothetical protein